MKNSAPGGLLSRQDLNILESAEVLLRPDRPDQFDYGTLSTLCGMGRSLVRERFPYPELLSVGIVAVGWEAEQKAWAHVAGQDHPLWDRKLKMFQCLGRQWLDKPNGFQLRSRAWIPDSALLEFYSEHPAVRSYRKGQLLAQSASQGGSSHV